MQIILTEKEYAELKTRADSAMTPEERQKFAEKVIAFHGSEILRNFHQHVDFASQAPPTLPEASAEDYQRGLLGQALTLVKSRLYGFLSEARLHADCATRNAVAQVDSTGA